MTERFYEDLQAVARYNGATKDAPHPWLWREYAARARARHPAITEALNVFSRPQNYHQLLLEAPHLPQDRDALRVAFTANDQKGLDDRQTVVALGKYLSRHWPKAQAHHIRDLVGRYAPDTILIWDTVPNIIKAVEDGPQSCMATAYHGGRGHPFWGEKRAYDDWHAATLMGTTPGDEPDWDKHPYAAYDPGMGWGVCVRLDSNGRVFGRCVVHTGKKVFVRSYCRTSAEATNNSFGSDHKIESWLEDLGYKRYDRWPTGLEFKYLEHPHCDRPMMPYLDGSRESTSRWVEIYDGRVTKIDGPKDRYSFECDCTDGELSAYDDDDMSSCSDCGQLFDDDDDLTCVGRDEDGNVCSACLDSYTLVRGSSRWTAYREYYEHDNVGEVYNSFYVDTDNLPEEIVMLEEPAGCCDYAHLSDAVRTGDGYYIPEVHDVVELAAPCPEGFDWALESNAWEDTNGDWHHDSVEFITFEGGKYLLSDSWACEGTGLLYPNCEDSDVDPETGDTVHPDWLEPCSRQADFILRYAEGHTQHMLLPDPPIVKSPCRVADLLDERFILAA